MLHNVQAPVLGCFGLSIVLAIAAGCTTTTVSVPPVEVNHCEWVCDTGIEGQQLLTPNYDVRTSSADTVLHEYLPTFMETALEQYQELVPPAGEQDERMKIYIFANRPQWAEFTRLYNSPVQANTYLHLHSGGYMDHQRQTVVMWDLGRDHTLGLLAHEGMHQYMACYFPENIPSWLNEGLACQWETFDLQGKRPVFTPRMNYLRRNNLRLALADMDGQIDLPRLLGMNPGYAVRKTGPMVRYYYAQVWSLVLFLREGHVDEYKEGFRNLLADLGTKRMKAAASAYRATNPEATKLSNGEVVFRHYITEDLDTFSRHYHDFARSLVF
jgi:hypothetical protein